MKASTIAASAAALAIVDARVANPADGEQHYRTFPSHDLVFRAEPANQPHGYTPQTNDCPSSPPSVRPASGLSSQERQWLPIRRNATIQPMRDLFSRLDITDFDADSYFNEYSNDPTTLPNIAIAASGGGYRAMLNAAGHIYAWDNRTTNSTSRGQLGGLLQSATYLAGLSGGSWLVGSLYTNNFTSIDSILAQDTSSDKSGDLWQFDQSIFKGPDSGGIQLLNTVGYYDELLSAVHDKSDAGFDTTITDYWGRALSYQLVNASQGGPDFTWSSIADQDWFTQGQAPLPLIVCDSRRPGEKLIPDNTTIFTFDPWEFGTFDPTVYGFVPMEYVGTNFTGGNTTSNKCVTGFDNVGYVMGTSSSLFNEALLQLNGSSNNEGAFSDAVQKALEAILSDIGQADDDIADYPNPFYGWNSDTNALAVSPQLTLVDGGEDGQNIPLNPLIQPIRQVDVIFAIDSSADTNDSFPTTESSANWPDGFSLTATYERSLSKIQNGTSFPVIPDVNTFYNLGLNNRPTFFGCPANNLTGPTPLIVYLPNAPYVYNSNVSTYDLKYSDSERNAIVMNAYNGATQGNGTLDAEWPACVGCAILARSMNRTNTKVPDICTSCFNRYCWNGTYDTRTPGTYAPSYKLGSDVITVKGAAGRLQIVSTFSTLLVAAIVSLTLL